MKPFDTEEREIVYLPFFNDNGEYSANYNYMSMESYTKNRDFFVSTLGLSQPNIIDFVRTTIVPHYQNDKVIENETHLKDFYMLIHDYFEFKRDMDKRSYDWDTNSDGKDRACHYCQCEWNVPLACEFHQQCSFQAAH